MAPITFQCVELFRQSPRDITAQILDLERWTEFHGYEALPGITAAEF
jgi:hypothetical protein